jgi:hypothetical protein
MAPKNSQERVGRAPLSRLLNDQNSAKEGLKELHDRPVHVVHDDTGVSFMHLDRFSL